MIEEFVVPSSSKSYVETVSVWVSARFTRLHCWPSAPEVVSFLRSPHRHVFHVHASVSVSHNDRQVEFLQFKELLKSWLDEYENTDISNAEKLFWSCEMFAADLVAKIAEVLEHPLWISVSVSEDGENGATVTRRTDTPIQIQLQTETQ